MRKAVSVSYIISICVLLLMATSNTACGRSIIKGKVVDRDTGKPIEKAAVFIEWMKSKGMPGLSYASKIETVETLSDTEGVFEIPVYSTLTNDFKLIVYKNGYVCWSSRRIFPSYEKQKDFSLQDGLTIKLEQFRAEFSREKHAEFTILEAIGSSDVFFEATKHESQLHYELIRKNAKEKEGSR